MAFGTSAVRTVEGKRARFKFRYVDAAVWTSQSFRVELFVTAYDRYLHQPTGQLHGQPDGHFKARLNPSLYQKPVHHNFDSVVLTLVERDTIFESDKFAVDAGPGESVLGELFEFLLEFTFAAADDGSEHHDAIFRFQCHHALHDLCRSLSRNPASALRTVGHTDRGVKQPKV